MTSFIAGIDEAGRGPVIGPLVIAVAAIEEEKQPLLKTLGVKDSKLLTETQRENILEKLQKIIQYKLIMLQPPDIDEVILRGISNLNWLEADTGAKILDDLAHELKKNHINISTCIIDCPSTNIVAYKNYFASKLTHKEIVLQVEHKADFNHLIVGAASIIAKVTREKELEKLRKKFNVDFGSGYPSDPKTKKFVEEYHANPTYSSLFRKSWATYTNIAKKHAKQSKLDGF